MVDKNLLKEYIKYFGDKPPIPPDNIMRTLVKMKTDGTFEEKLEQFNSINDEFREWYENGNKKTEGNFKGEKKNGLWIRWYENGQKKMEGFFKEGKLNGKWIKWFEDGKKWEEGYYLNGNEVGQWTYWRDDGTKRKEGVYYDNNLKPIEDGDPIPDGKWIYYNEDDSIQKEETYKEGKLISRKDFK